MEVGGETIKRYFRAELVLSVEDKKVSPVYVESIQISKKRPSRSQTGVEGLRLLYNGHSRLVGSHVILMVMEGTRPRERIV